MRGILQQTDRGKPQAPATGLPSAASIWATEKSLNKVKNRSIKCFWCALDWRLGRPQSHHGRCEKKESLSLQTMESQTSHLPSATFVADVSIIPDPQDVEDRQEAVTGAQNNIRHEQYAQCGAKS